MDNYHYFASTAMAWATADTREEAIKKAIRHSGTSDVKRITLRLHKEGKEGFYCWSVQVLAPSDAKYSIEWYKPQGVDLVDGRHHAVTYITEKELAYTTRKTKD